MGWTLIHVNETTELLNILKFYFHPLIITGNINLHTCKKGDSSLIWKIAVLSYWDVPLAGIINQNSFIWGKYPYKLHLVIWLIFISSENLKPLEIKFVSIFCKASIELLLYLLSCSSYLYHYICTIVSGNKQSNSNCILLSPKLKMFFLYNPSEQDHFSQDKLITGAATKSFAYISASDAFW